MKVGLTNHAIARYQERVKPALDLDAARRELATLAATLDESMLLDQMPSSSMGGAEPKLRYLGVRYAEIAPGIWIALAADPDRNARYDAISVFTHSEFGPEIRARRMKRRSEKRARKKRNRGNANRNRHQLGGRPDESWAA